MRRFCLCLLQLFAEDFCADLYTKYERENGILYDTYVAYVHLSTFHTEFLGPLVMLKGLLQESARLKNSGEVEGDLSILWRKRSSDSVPKVNNEAGRPNRDGVCIPQVMEREVGPAHSRNDVCACQVW